MDSFNGLFCHVCPCHAQPEEGCLGLMQLPWWPGSAGVETFQGCVADLSLCGCSKVSITHQSLPGPGATLQYGPHKSGDGAQNCGSRRAFSVPGSSYGLCQEGAARSEAHALHRLPVGGQACFMSSAHVQ